MRAKKAGSDTLRLHFENLPNSTEEETNRENRRPNELTFMRCYLRSHSAILFDWTRDWVLPIEESTGIAA